MHIIPRFNLAAVIVMFAVMHPLTAYPAQEGNLSQSAAKTEDDAEAAEPALTESAKIATSFQGEVNADEINIRVDSTPSSQLICRVNKGENLDVVSEKYDWYRVRLPSYAPSFIKKGLVEVIEEKAVNLSGKETPVVNQTQSAPPEIPVHGRTAKVIKSRVNIRLAPNESSPILGKVSKNEIIHILEDKGDWYKIEPVNNSFGWIHKKFVDKAKPGGTRLARDTQKAANISGETALLPESVVIVGLIKPYGKVIMRPATHKLITEENKTILLKGNRSTLDTLNYQKVKVTGRFITSERKKYPVLEIQKIEALD